MQDKVKLVQDGELNELMVRAFAEDERTGRVISRVADVTFTSATDAKVTFSLFRNSTTVLPRGRGTVVLQDDVWKMSFKTLCVLTEYGQDVPQAGTC
ncbi:hypothetical protein [Nonomuraea roseola]|uniref:Low molecular weight antigen MTB12-like C-terminal domain-containing protein n=1 Tax=Nonomuraea roseola TaxID=46179 RepID=A0ABV5PT80_9ACTN